MRSKHWGLRAGCNWGEAQAGPNGLYVQPKPRARRVSPFAMVCAAFGALAFLVRFFAHRENRGR